MPLFIDYHQLEAGLNENGEADPAYRIVLVAQYPDFGTLNGNEQRNEDTTDQAKNMLVTAHQRLNISENDFEIANIDTIEALEANGVDSREIDEVIDILNSLKGDVVGK